MREWENVYLEPYQSTDRIKVESGWIYKHKDHNLKTESMVFVPCESPIGTETLKISDTTPIGQNEPPNQKLQITTDDGDGE